MPRLTQQFLSATDAGSMALVGGLGLIFSGVTAVAGIKVYQAVTNDPKL